MRIISGKYGGRRINPPAHMPHTRPTTDRAKEGLFNMAEVQLGLEGIRSLDLFGGTGCISYELASRGATELHVVEKDARQAAFIRQTAAALAIPGLQVYRMDVFRFLAQDTRLYHFIFAGPPYALPDIDRIPEVIFARPRLEPGGWFVLEHTAAHHFEQDPHFVRQRHYGSTIFSIFTQDQA